MQLVIYLILVALLVYFISKRAGGFPVRFDRPLQRTKAAPSHSNEIWIQVYETASIEEARLVRARLQEENMECVLYEQGKKDIRGNLLKGIGIAVPRSVVSQAQACIARIPV